MHLIRKIQTLSNNNHCIKKRTIHCSASGPAEMNNTLNIVLLGNMCLCVTATCHFNLLYTVQLYMFINIYGTNIKHWFFFKENIIYNNFTALKKLKMKIKQYIFSPSQRKRKTQMQLNRSNWKHVRQLSEAILGYSLFWLYETPFVLM